MRKEGRTKVWEGRKTTKRVRSPWDQRVIVTIETLELRRKQPSKNGMLTIKIIEELQLPVMMRSMVGT